MMLVVAAFRVTLARTLRSPPAEECPQRSSAAYLQPSEALHACAETSWRNTTHSMRASSAARASGYSSHTSSALPRWLGLCGCSWGTTPSIQKSQQCGLA